MDIREKLEKVLRENGADGFGGIHSWRCQWPDIYGPCTCLETLLDDLVVTVEQHEW